MNKYKIQGNNLIYDNKIIKTLEEEERTAGETIIYILNNFRLETEEPEIIELFAPNSFSTPQGTDPEEIEQIIIPILLINQNHFINPILKNKNLTKFLEKITEEPPYYYMDMSEYEEMLTKMLEIPEKLQHYFNFKALLCDMDINGEIQTYSLKHIDSPYKICTFLVEYGQLEDFCYNLDL